MATKKEITKEEKILKEQRRLKRIFADLEEGKKKLVTPLIEKAAFMSIELDELQETIQKKNCIYWKMQKNRYRNNLQGEKYQRNSTEPCKEKLRRQRTI